MKCEIKPTAKFQKDLKKAHKRGCDISVLTDVVNALSRGEVLPQKYKDHNLIGKYVGCRECHLKPDWLLIYQIRESALYLARTGTHSDLF